MLNKIFWQTLSQATTATIMSIVILAVSGNIRANAANLVKISGIFENKTSISPEDSQQSNQNLANGFFNGTYKIGVEPVPDSLNLNELVSIQLNPNSLNPNEVVSFQNQNMSFLDMLLEFLGITITSPDTALALPANDGKYEYSINVYELGANNYAISFQSQPAPEPLTLSSTIVAGAIGLWLKRNKQKVSHKV